MLRYIYLDESVFAEPNDHTGYGALATDEPIGNLYIKEALANLGADPDIKDPRTQFLDRRTLERQYFHASEDSRNAHSHFCRSLNKNISGHFSCNFFDLSKRRTPTGQQEALSLAAKLSTITHLHMMESKQQTSSAERVARSLRKVLMYLMVMPNTALQRTRPLLRIRLNVNSSGWGLAAEGSR